MPTSRKTVDYIVEQASGAGAVAAKPMFGEYGLYCDGKMVAVIGDDQLFMKRTAAGRVLAHSATEASPYPGAKPCLVIDAEQWDDGEWLSELVRVTADELPIPKPKKQKGLTKAG